MVVLLRTQRELHLRKAEKVRQNLNDFRKNATTQHLAITFDLQKTLICPVVSCGIAYYKRQLSVYNLAVHNLADDSASMFMWDESKAGRGPSETGSCLLRYIDLQIKNHQMKNRRVSSRLDDSRSAANTVQFARRILPQTVLRIPGLCHFVHKSSLFPARHAPCL